MSEAVVDDIVAVLPPLLQSLEALGFIGRHLHPPEFGRVMQAAGEPDLALRAVRAQMTAWPEEFSDVRAPLATGALVTRARRVRTVEKGRGRLCRNTGSAYACDDSDVR